MSEVFFRDLWVYIGNKKVDVWGVFLSNKTWWIIQRKWNLCIIILLLHWKKLVSWWVLSNILNTWSSGRQPAVSCTRTLESFRYVLRFGRLSHFSILQRSKRWSFKKSPKLLPVHQMTEMSHLKSKGKQKLSWLIYGISIYSVWFW